MPNNPVFPHGEPELPQGETNLPDWHPTTNLEPVEPATFPEGVDINAIPIEFMADAQQLPVDQRDLVLQWFPHLYRQPSQHLDGAQLRTPAQFIKHLHGVARLQEDAERATDHKDASERRKQIIARTNEREKRASNYHEWLSQCQARKAWIADLKNVVSKRKAERQDFLDSLKPTLDQWDAYVDAADSEYKAARATVPPARLF